MIAQALSLYKNLIGNGLNTLKEEDSSGVATATVTDNKGGESLTSSADPLSISGGNVGFSLQRPGKETN